MKLKPIKPRKISDQVFDQLRELIFRGTLNPGDKIMTERELSMALNVSRTAVRDAIKKLVAMGLVTQIQGKGTFVHNANRGNLNLLKEAMGTEEATLHDLLEVRMGLECNSAAMAAVKASDNDILHLSASIEELKLNFKKDERGTRADISFHMALSFATGNPLQIYLMKQIHDILSTGINTLLTKLYEDKDNIKIIISQHEIILIAIKNRNEENAFNAMKKHIEFVMAFEGDI